MRGETYRPLATPDWMRRDTEQPKESSVNRMPNDQALSEWLERAWLQRYLERQLSDAETEWFEMYVLDKPHLLADIETDNDLRDGLALVLSASTDGVDAPTSTPGPGHGGPTRFRWQHMAWAASVVAAMGLGALLAGPLASGDRSAASLIVASPSRVVFDTLRGIESPPLVYRGAEGSDYVLVEVGLPPDATNVVLHLAGHEPMPLVVSPDGFASFLVARRGLGSTLRIEYVSAGEPRNRVLDALAACRT